MFTKEWMKAAGIRAVKTVAQTAVAMIPVAATVAQVDWKAVIGTAVLAGITSLLTSLAGLPEVQQKNWSGRRLSHSDNPGGGFLFGIANGLNQKTVIKWCARGGYKGVSVPQESPHGRASRMEREVFGKQNGQNHRSGNSPPPRLHTGAGGGLIFCVIW